MTDSDDPGQDAVTRESAGLLSQLFAPGEDFGALAAATDPPLHWPSLDPDQAGTEWPALHAWVTQLQHRFPEMVRLPACWYRHNGLVETLAALRDHEHASYATTAAPTAAVGWHTAFHEIETRLRAWIADLRCGGDPTWHTHHPTNPAPPAPPQDLAVWITEVQHTRQQRT